MERTSKYSQEQQLPRQKVHISQLKNQMNSIGCH